MVQIHSNAMVRPFTFVAALVLVGQMSVAKAESLNPSRVHLVDADGSNLLFRGNMPTVNHSFAYSTLTNLLKQRTEAKGLIFPSNFSLVVVSFNNDFDGQDFKAEKAFWKQHTPELGRLINWPLGLAGIVPPKDVPSHEREKMANGSVWKIDKVPQRVVALRQLLTTKAARPTVIYVHCTAGCDRTGEVVGSYRLKFHPMINVTQMYALDVAECGRPPNYWSTMALEWFCIYMQENGRGDLTGCTDFAKCKFAGKCTPT